MEEGAIPWIVIHQYAEVNGIDGEQRDDLFFHLAALDRAYLKWRRENSKGKG